MEGYDRGTYGDRVADAYDRWYEDRPGAEDELSVLQELSAEGPVLELGVGTGRVAIPLALSGREVFGLDESLAMIERLKSKPGGELVHTFVGDFSQFSLAKTFHLAFSTFYSLGYVADQETQVRCFAAVRRHLEAGGLFAVELPMPSESRFTPGHELEVPPLLRFAADELTFRVGRHDQITQIYEYHHISFREGKFELFPTRLRYVWPTELDLMARLGGFILRDRWADWSKRTFTSREPDFISVYEAV